MKKQIVIILKFHIMNIWETTAIEIGRVMREGKSVGFDSPTEKAQKERGKETEF